MTLAHLTLTTGDLHMSPRAEVADDVIALLAPIIAGGDASVPISGMEGLSVIVRRKNADGSHYQP